MPAPTLDMVGDTGISAPARFNLTSTDEREVNIGRQERIGDILTFGLPSVVAGMADTFGTSLGLIDDNSVESFLKQTYQPFGDYYARNREGARVIGDLTGMFIPGLAAEKVIRGGGLAYRALSKLTGADSVLLKSVFTSGKSYDELLEGVRARDLFLANAGSRKIGEDLIRKGLARQALTTGLLDTTKRTVAFELGVLGTMNSSDVLYPDEYDMVDNIALNLAAPTIFAGAEGLFLRRELRRSIQSVGVRANEVLNPEGIPFENVIFRPGNRDGGITLYSTAATAGQKEFEEARLAIDRTGSGDDLRMRNFNAETLNLNNVVKTQVEKLGSDSTVKNLTNRITLSPSQTKAAMDAQKQDPTSLLGTESIENVGDDIAGTVKGFYDARTDLIDRFDLRIVQKQDALSAPGLASDESIKLTKELNELQKEKEKIEGLEFFVLEADGTISLARNRKSLYQDGSRKIEKVRPTENEPAYFVAKVDDKVFSVTEDGIAVIPPLGVEENKIAGINATRILSSHDVKIQAEKQSKLLQDVAFVYHPFHGQLGKPIANKMSETLRAEVHKWNGNSGSSQIRRWIADNDPRAREFYNANEPMRERLREIAGPDGTVTLYRGENKEEDDWIKKFQAGDPSANPAMINDVVSMSAKVELSHKAFGGGSSGAISGKHTIAKEVHVDDIVGIAGFEGEFEYIVKNNRQRVIGDVISKRGFRALDLKHRSALYDAYQAAIENYKPKGDGSLIVTENDHHTRLDFVRELLSKPDGWKKDWDAAAVARSIKLPRGVNSLDDLDFMIADKKLEEYKQIQDMIEAANKRKLHHESELMPDYKDIERLLNLPGTPWGTPHPMLMVFDEIARHQGDVSLSQAVRSVEHFQHMMQEHAFFPDLTAFRGNVLQMRGRMMDIPRDQSPSILIKRPLKHDDYFREALFNRALEDRMFVNHILANADKDGGFLVKEIYDQINGMSATKAAKQVETLNQGQQRGSNLFLQGQFAAGENAAMQGIHLVENVSDRTSRKYITDNIMAPHMNKFAAVRSKTANVREFNLFSHARRQGWDLEDRFEQQGDLFFVPLRATKDNRIRWKSIYGEDMPEKEKVYLPAPTGGALGSREYKPLGVNADTAAALQATHIIGKEALDNSNVIRRALGLTPLKLKEHWLPPKNFHNQETVFLVTPDGRMHSVHNGRTIQDAKKKAEAEIANANGTLFMVDQTTADRYFTLRDEAFTRMLDYSDPLNQTGKATGKSVGDVIEIGEGILNDINENLIKQMESITRRTRALYFEPQLNYARHMMNASGSEALKSGQSVWQHYFAAVYGNQTINPNHFEGKLYSGIESFYDQILNAAYDKVRGLSVAGKVTTANKIQEREYKALQDQLGDFNPFSDAVDYANRTYRVSFPPNMKQHMAAMNKFVSFITLQMFEIGHAVLNLSSLMANTPAVIKSLQRLPDETREQHLTRIAAFGSSLNDSDLVMFNPHRASAYGFHMFFSEEGRPIRERAKKRGYFNQDVAEMDNMLNAPFRGNIANFVHNIGEKISYVSDKSEEISRGISFMMGYGIAKRGLGIQGEKDAFAFAHDFANKVIGDYRPNNRPRIFQGAVGMPLGLFMTFAQNYFQRLFSYVENKQIGALVTQYATQAAVFGAQTVPGFQQFNDIFVENYDGSVNLADGLQNAFGPRVADVILYGALGNLPKFLGSDDGFAIHTRGDANIQRIPGLWSVGNTPGYNTLKNGYDLLANTFSMLKTNGGYNNQQMMEILANYSQNRLLRNAFTLFAGYATDRRGQVVNDDVYAAPAIAARLLGFRPLSEAKKAEAHARMRAGQLSQDAKMAELRSAFRAGIRSGNMDEEQFGDLIRKYLKYGGNPRSIPRFIVDQYRKGLVDRDTLELVKAFSDPSRMTDVKRLLNAGALPQNDPYFEQGASQ